jgi:hypothetical protein
MNQSKNNVRNYQCNNPECELTRTGTTHSISSHKDLRPNSGWPWHFEPPFCADKDCFKNKKRISHYEHECGKFLVNEGTKGQNVLVGFLAGIVILVFGITISFGVVFGINFFDAKLNDFFVYGTFIGNLTSFALVFTGYHLYKRWGLLWEALPTYDYTFEEWLKIHRPPLTYKCWRIFLGMIVGFGVLFLILFVLSTIIGLK